VATFLTVSANTLKFSAPLGISRERASARPPCVGHLRLEKLVEAPMDLVRDGVEKISAR